MKNYRSIALILLWWLTINTMISTYAADRALKQLEVAEASIDSIIQQITKTKQQLVDTEEKFMEQAIKPISKAQEQLAKQRDMIKRGMSSMNKGLKYVKNVSIVIPLVLQPLIANPINTLNKTYSILEETLNKPLATIATTLANLKTTFSTVRKNFDVKVDPQNIYMKLKEADDAFNAAKKDLEKIEELVKTFGDL